jgi:hypothetical protein
MRMLNHRKDEMGESCDSCVDAGFLVRVIPDEEESQSLEDVKDASSSVVEESKDASKFGSSRRVDTNEGRAVPFFCWRVGFCEGEERRTHDFAFHEFVWEVYEFFHFCFPDLGVALKGSAREPHREVFDWDGKDVDRPYPASACDTVREDVYAFFCKI